MSVKALLNYVLEEVAIDGEQGTDVEELFKYVNDFYVKNRHERHNVSELLWMDRNEDDETAGQPKASDGAFSKGRDCWGTPNVKEEFQEYIWELLKQQADFDVGPKNESRHMSLGEIVDKWSENKDDEKLRVYASEDRRWRTLTGHGVDPKKVPNAVFKCLEVIGKHREQGLIQPELTKITGQDKKSIAGRTTLLKELGYIEKVGVLAKGMNTSKLTLTKFAIQRDRKRAQGAKEEKKRKDKNAVPEGNESWTGETIHLESLVRAIITELKNAKNGVVQRGDLKKKLGMDKSRFHWRSLSRILRKVETYGVWRRIRVPLPTNRSYDKRGSPNVTVRCHARCIKFLRDMTNEDWRKLAYSAKLAIQEDEDEASDGEDDKAEQDNEDMDVEAFNEQLANVDVDAIEEDPREVPQWTVNLPMPNIIFNLVNSAGKEGLSSMDIVHRVIGSFYYRPMDQILHRMTDFPSKSQPAEYIHLAVIRETSITHRQTHYHYFSYDHHQALVKEGLAVEPWAPKAKKKGVMLGSLAGAEDPPQSLLKVQELDEYGFPPVDTSRLLKQDGTGTLGESALVGKKKENIAAIQGKPGWKKGVVLVGRPRKYAPGQEPYLSAKKRKASAEAALLKRSLEDTQDGQNEDVPEILMNTPKRRGRPPKKQKTEGEPKRRGRPPKAKNAPPVTPQVESTETPAGTPAGTPVDTPVPKPKKRKTDTPGEPKRRGRPPKANKAATVTPQLQSSTANIAETPNPPKTPASPEVATSEATPQVPVADTTIATPVPAEESTPAAKRRGRKSAAAPAPKVTKTTRKRKAVSPAPEPLSIEKRSKPDAPVDGDIEMPLAPEVPTLGTGQEQTALLQGKEGQEPQSRPVLAESTPVASSADFEAGLVPSVDAQAEGVQPAEQSEIVADEAQVEPSVAFSVDGISVEAEPIENEDNDCYGSIGGMLALGRQQAVLDLVAEHQGVFPGGNELRHAFNKKYKTRNPKAGVADRRLVRGIVQSLQHKGKINQYTFSFMTARGVMTTKKLLVDAKIPVDSPLVADTIREMKAADGNLWFPPGTDLPADVQEKVLNPITTWVQAKPSVIEGIEFERMFPTSVEQIKKQREARAAERAAMKSVREEEKRARQEMRALKKSGVIGEWTGKFTEKQREEARRRKAELKEKFHKLKNKYTIPVDDDEAEDGRGASQPSIWWDDFVQRADGKSFMTDVKNVRQWEMCNALGPEGETPNPEGGLVMINHFGPEVEVGEDFSQAPPEMGSIIRDVVTEDGLRAKVTEIVEKPSQSLKTSAETPVTLQSMEAEPEPLKKRRRRRVLQKKPTVSRRQQAMDAIHGTTTIEAVVEEQEIHARKDWSYRNKYTIPKEDEETLLIAVIIARTIFGNVDRKINWDLVQKATPQHEPTVLQRRWPRVRDQHKTHLKKLQSEFEEMYLESYEKGLLPPIKLSDPMSFDLPLHVKWFRDNLELPEANTVPELSSKREIFDDLYNLRPEKPSMWRADYHNQTFTMGNRANHFVCYAYECPMKPEKIPGESGGVVDYVKSIIKSNIITDAATYNPAEAFALIRAQPEDAVDEAFFELSNQKVVAHKKDHNRVAPGRNYELTDKFHLALRTPMDEKLFAQAIKFDRSLQTMFGQKEALELSPFVNDGSMACIFDLVASRRVRLEKREYKANTMGLVNGYETRSMPKHMVDFKIDLRAEPSYVDRPTAGAVPPIPEGKTGNPIEPIRIWIDMNGNVVKGMWLRVATTVLSLITGRPGIHPREIAKMLNPGVTLIEAMDIVKWLHERGVVEFNRELDTEAGCWSKEGFYRALGGL